MNRDRYERLTVFFLALYVLGSLYVVVSLAVGITVHFLLVAACTVAFFVFAVLHAGLTLGRGHSLVFFAISSVVSVVFELLGTSRGWIYGAYSYTDRLGPKLLGLVPLLIPLAWFMMMYASYALANMLTGYTGARQQRASPARLLWLVFLSAMIMTSWDLVNDPINVAGGHWVWVENGAYFGIPISNYAGWLLTTLVVFLFYRLYETWRAPTATDAHPRYFTFLPVLAYAVTMLANVASLSLTGQPGPAMVGMFSMGAFLAAAISRHA